MSKTPPPQTRSSFLNHVVLTSAGNVVLLEDEVEVKYVDNVAILEQTSNKQAGAGVLPPGLIVLTNFRIISIINDPSSSSSSSSSSSPYATNNKSNVNHGKSGWGFELSHVVSVDDCKSSFIGRSSRLHFELRSIESGQQSTSTYYLGLKFPDKSGEKEAFLSSTRQFLAKRSWEILKQKGPHQRKHHIEDEDSSFSTVQAGVAGILRRQEENLRASDEITREALGDLDSLMKRAREVASMVQRYASFVAASAEREKNGGDSTHATSSTEEGDGAGSGGGSGGGDEYEMDLMLQSMGIASPVTKLSAGRLFHQQLARQLADFLLDHGRLQRMGRMATLTDVYGIFNRARGTELVSPDDFLRAVEMVGALQVGITTMRFPSGAYVLALDTMTEQTLGQELLVLSKKACTRQEQGLYAQEVAQSYRTSLVVAKEMLLTAESNSYLCRDDTIGGVAYYPNKFNDFI